MLADDKVDNFQLLVTLSATFFGNISYTIACLSQISNVHVGNCCYGDSMCIVHAAR